MSKKNSDDGVELLSGAPNTDKQDAVEAFNEMARIKYEALAGEAAKGFVTAMSKAGEQIGIVEKDGHNDYHDYDYVTEAAIKRAVGPALREAGLALVAVSHEVMPGSTFEKVMVRTTVIVQSAGGHQATAVAIGTGMDKQDKAAYKAMAGGLKYALTSLFLIPTPNEDAEFERSPARSSTPAQKEVKTKKEEPASESEAKAEKKAAKKAVKAAAESESESKAEVNPTESTNIASKMLTEISEAKSETELKKIASGFGPKRPKVSQEDYEIVLKAFKERMAKVKEA